MLIVSWNVAGLKPALQRIQSDYGTPTSSDSSSIGSSNAKCSKPKPKPDPSRAFANYLHLHGSVDILCLQEHKIPLSQLSSRSEPDRCSTIDGYESFWSCVTTDQKSRGFNGVVTYAKVGLVQAADCTPLKDAELDGQGRCILTDHGKFVVFNVYVPYSRDAETLAKKMKFLNALRGAMERQRELGKHVILVGDLNLKIDKRDVFWRWRNVYVDVVLNQMKENRKDENHGWKKDIANNWDEIVRVLHTIEALPRQTKNPLTKKTHDRYIARVKLAENKYITLGNYEDTAEDALGCYDINAKYYINPYNETSTIYRKANCLSIDTLAELMAKIVNVTWDNKVLRQISESSESGLNPDLPSYMWMKRLLDDDGMVDVFRHFYPAAEARFTCWHQMKNMRYSNAGGRIDFTLVDKALLTHVELNNNVLLRCGRSNPHDNPLGEEAALLAATASGLFVPGTFAGGGIADATKRALDTQFAGKAHSGMIYTPPSYSDHIAVSLLMKNSFGVECAGNGELSLGGDASTRKAQPHKKQRSVASFFSAAGSKSSSTSSGSVSSSLSSSCSGEKRAIISQDINNYKSSKKKSIHSYFGEPKGKSTKESSGNPNSTKSASSNKKSYTPRNSVLKHFGKK